MLKFLKQTLVFFLFFSLLSTSALACTRLLYKSQDAVWVGRTMDWYQDMKTNLMVYPQGISRDGMATSNSLHWTSKYGSLVATVFDMMTVDGINEQGLAAHILWLEEADYGKTNPKVNTLSVLQWAQYYLDNFKNVAEAVQFTQTQPLQLEGFSLPNVIPEGIKVHLALEDASGDSAIIEYINGKANIYHSQAYTVLTNSPVYPEQLRNLNNYQGFGGEQALPGTTSSADRFVRGAYYLKYLPQGKNNNESLMYLLSVVQNIAEPFSVPNQEQKDIEPTIWRVAIDLTHRVYYFNAATNLNFISIQLNKFNLANGTPTLKLDLSKGKTLAGDVSEHFQPMR